MRTKSIISENNVLTAFTDNDRALLPFLFSRLNKKKKNNRQNHATSNWHTQQKDSDTSVSGIKRKREKQSFPRVIAVAIKSLFPVLFPRVIVALRRAQGITKRREGSRLRERVVEDVTRE